MNEYINRGILMGGQATYGGYADSAGLKNLIPTKGEQIAILDKGRDDSDTTVLSIFENSKIIDSFRFVGKNTSNFNISILMFIKEAEREIERIKRKGTRKEKLAYLKTRMKNKQSIRKQVNKLINERIR